MTFVVQTPLTPNGISINLRPAERSAECSLRSPSAGLVVTAYTLAEARRELVLSPALSKGESLDHEAHERSRKARKAFVDFAVFRALRGPNAPQYQGACLCLIRPQRKAMSSNHYPMP